MAVRNGGLFLAQAIESILGQTFTDFELVVVDDASTDGTPEVLRAFQARDGRLVVLRNEERQERSRSRNRAIAAACGRYIAVMDADDVAMPTRLERQVERMERCADLGLLATWAYEIDFANRLVGAWRPPTDDAALRRAMLSGNPFFHSSVMFRRAALELNGLYDEALVSSEDYDLYWRITRAWRCANLPEFLALWRLDWQRQGQVHRLRRFNTLRVRWRWFRRAGVGPAAYVRLLPPLVALCLPPRVIAALRRQKRRLYHVAAPPEVLDWLAAIERRAASYVRV